MRAFARSPLAILAAGAWGYAEATRFWLIPDILLCWIGLNRPKSIVPSVGVALIGATLGGVAMHARARDEYSRLTQIPGISEAMLVDARERFASQRWAAVVRAPLDGIPYKVYATISGVVDARLLELIAWTPPARVWRFMLTAGASGLVGAFASGHIRRHDKGWLLAVVGFWVVVYVRYFARLRRTYG